MPEAKGRLSHNISLRSPKVIFMASDIRRVVAAVFLSLVARSGFFSNRCTGVVKKHGSHGLREVVAVISVPLFLLI